MCSLIRWYILTLQGVNNLKRGHKQIRIQNSNKRKHECDYLHFGNLVLTLGEDNFISCVGYFTNYNYYNYNY